MFFPPLIWFSVSMNAKEITADMKIYFIQPFIHNPDI